MIHAPDSLDDRRTRIERELEQKLPDSLSDATRLLQAMRYGVLGGGKRIRALLTLLTAEMLEVDEARLMPAACALEFIHAYSLIHDDLPAMDDDDLRRGQPSTHKAFDDATAILAGDALQALAFESIATADALSAEIRVRQSARLARAAGAAGMVGGQMLDMAAEAQCLDQQALERIHQTKTGALLEAAVLLAADTRPDLQAGQNQGLQLFARRLGLAYQLRDDLLDIQGDTETLGKPQGSDLERSKATFPSLLGEAATARYCDALHQEAADALGVFGDRAAPLLRLSEQLLQRRF